jgi:hypothetical protein
MTKEKFFGRQEYLEIITKRLSGLKDGYRQNIAIIGDELVGKTSIIFNLLDKFYDTGIIMLYLEIRPEPLSSFARRFSGSLLYNFLSGSGIILQEDLEFLILKSEKYIPHTVEKIKAILHYVKRGKKNNVFTELLGLSEIIKQETGKSVVVILDEFQNLENLGCPHLYQEWSKLLLSQKNTMYIITSSMKFKAQGILSKNLSLLFGNFEVINVEPFDIKTSERYIEERLCGVNLNRGLRDFLVHFTGGCPFYLEVITEALVKAKQEELADIIEKLLYDASGILNQRFSNYLKRFMDSEYSNEYISILYLISSGRNKIKDIAHILKKQRKELNLRITRLLELDTITRCGDFLKINDRVFGFWLRFVYQEKLNSLTFDARNQKTLFRNKIEGMVNEFLLNSARPLLERMEEIFRLFEDETVQLEKRKVRLNHFREIKPLEFSNNRLKNGLICRSQDSLWITAFKHDCLNEEDITAFSKECKKYRHKLQRKIIVTLHDLDMNTRLKALEEKIWAWDINQLNEILDLFSKPRVIAS